MEKRSGKNFGRRMLSLVLALVMCVSLLNITALAADGSGAELVCGQSEHTHSAECYGPAKLVCGQEEFEGHTHTEACYNHTIAPTCGTEESEGHHHNDSCYTEVETLNCDLGGTEGHVHTDACYTTERTLTCGQAESEGHHHSPACAGSVRVGDPICGKVESAGHAHSDSCYEAPLTCTTPEHTHTSACYAGDTGDAGDAGSQNIQDFLTDVTITNTDGSDVGGKLEIGKSYKIGLAFSEGGVQGSQFKTGGTLTYQLPEFFKVTAKSGVELYATIDGVPTRIGTYSVSDSGLLTVELSDEGKTALDVAGNVTLNFDMEATAQANPGSTGGSVKIPGAGKDFTFEIVDQPQVSMEKLGKYTENESHTGGALEYTVQVTVDHGDVKDAAITDELTPPQSEALDVKQVGDVVVTLTRGDDTFTLTEGVDYELVAKETDSANPFAPQAFEIRLTGERYNPLKLGDVLNVTYKYDVQYVPGTVDTFSGEVLNTATFTGTMPVEDPDGTGGTTDIPVKETRGSNIELTATPYGHGVVCKEQEYSEADKTLHYTCYTVVPAGKWNPLYIYDDMYTQYDGQKWYLQEFGEGGRVSGLKVSAVDLDGWFDWTDETTDAEKTADLAKYKDDAEELEGFKMYGDLSGYDSTDENQYVYFSQGKNVIIVFGYTEGKSDPRAWGSWDYTEHDRLIITEYDLDMSGNDTMTLPEMNGTRTLERTPDEVLKAGITNNVNLRYGGYYPGYAVFFNNIETMNKTGALNKAEGTIDYTVSINTTDSTIRKYFMDVKDNIYEKVVGWNFYKSMGAVFYDVLPDGWEYKEGSLYAVAVQMDGYKQEFHDLNNAWKSPLDDDKNIYVPLVHFWNNTAKNHELFNMFGDKLAKLEFHYTLKANDEWLKDHAADNDPTKVLNHAEIKDKNMTHWSANEDVDYYPAKLTKKAEQVEENANLMKFTLEINPQSVDYVSGSEYLTVTDTSTNLQIKLDSIQVKDAKGNDVEFKMLPATESGQFKLQVPDGMALTITYNAVIPEKGPGVAISNSASIDGVTGSDSGYNEILSVNKIYGGGSGSTYELTVEKTDSTNGAKKLAGADFKYYIVRSEGSKLRETGKITVGGNEYSVYTESGWTRTTNANGAFTITDKVEPGNYYILEEAKAPEGYELPDEPILFFYGFDGDMDKVTYPGAVAASGMLTVTNEPTPPPPPPGTGTTPDYTSLSVTKVWADEGHEEEQPSSVEVQLYRDGQPYGGTVTLSEADGWSHEWTRLDDDYTWTVDEVNAPEGYTVSVSGSGTTYTITNTYDNPPPPPDDDIPDDDIPLDDLPDMDIPLTDLPEEEIPLEDLPEEEIPDEDIPLDDVPQTGDSSRMALWLALMAGSGLGMAVLGIRSKKQEEEEQ